MISEENKMTKDLNKKINSNIIIDDGGDLTAMLHGSKEDLAEEI